jgi:hypothetical protein
MKKWKNVTTKGFKLKYIGLDSELGCYFAAVEKKPGQEVVEWFSDKGDPADHNYGNLVPVEPSKVATKLHAILPDRLSRAISWEIEGAIGYVTVDFYDDRTFKIKTLDSFPRNIEGDRGHAIRSKPSDNVGND